MKKYFLCAVAVLAVLSAAGCAGKSPFGKAPISTRS
jgi:hypothetical protein